VIYSIFFCALFGAAIPIAGGMDDHSRGEQVVIEDVGVVVKQIGV